MCIRGITGICLNPGGSFELLRFRKYVNTHFCWCIPGIAGQLCLKIMELYILFWLVCEWAFLVLKIGVLCPCVQRCQGVLFFVLGIVYGWELLWVCRSFFMGSLSCLYRYLGSQDYLFLLLLLFLWYELPIYIAHILI